METETRQYKDVAGNPVTLDWLVRNEPEWAANQIRHRDRLELAMKSPRPITPEDVTIESDRNYDLGRKHAKGEVAELTIEPLVSALQEMLVASSKVRLRVKENAPTLTKFSEWEELTEAMRTAERVIESSNAKITHSRVSVQSTETKTI